MSNANKIRKAAAEKQFNFLVNSIRESMKLGLDVTTDSLTEALADFCSDNGEAFNETNSLQDARTDSLQDARTAALMGNEIDTVLMSHDCADIMRDFLDPNTGKFSNDSVVGVTAGESVVGFTAGGKVSCIKQLRERTGAGLKEAKEFSERVLDELKAIK